MKISIVLAALTGMFETDLARASKTTEKRMRQIRTEAEKAGKAIGLALVAGATAAGVAIKAAIERADELSKTAQKIGVTTEALSTLAYAAQLADVDIGQLQGGLTRLTKAQGEAAEGNKELIALFGALNVRFQETDGTLRDTGDVFRDVAKALEGIPDGATKTKIALDLMGRSGANLIPLTKGLEAAEERARALGLELSQRAGKDAEEFNDQLSDVKLMVTVLASAVASDLLPDLIKLVRGFQDSTESGGGLKSVAGQIADAIRGIGTAAGTTFATIKTLTLGIVGMTTAVLQFLATYTLPGRLATTADQRQALGDLSAVALAGSEEARARVLSGAPEGVSPFSGSRGGRAAATRDAALEALRGEEAERAYAAAIKAAADAAAAAAEAKAGHAAATREATAAAREAAKREKEEAEAALKLRERLYEQQKELRDLANEEARQRAEALAAGKEVRDALQFELELLQMTNEEQTKAIALRGLSAEAIARYGDEIVALNRQIEENIKVAEGMDVLRGATEDLFSDLMSGAKSAKEAFRDFADSIIDNITRMLAKQWTEQLLGSFGTAGTGSSGGFFASLLGSLFGGGKAAGGPVAAGVPYLVGERGPELVIPKASGTVIPARQTAEMLRGGGDTFYVQGSMSQRAHSRIVIDRARRQQRETARTG